MRTKLIGVAVTALAVASSACASGHSARSSSSTALYTVSRRLYLSEQGSPYQLLAGNSTALYLTGTVYSEGGPEPDLLRLDLRSFAVSTSSLIAGPPPTSPEAGTASAALGFGALWVAAGQQLLRMNTTTLAVTARVPLPASSVFVTVAKDKVWCSTDSTLFAIDPTTDAVLHSDAIGFFPYAMAAAPDGSELYVLGDRQPSGPAVVAEYDPATGARLAEATIGSASVGPIAPANDGVWVPASKLRPSQETTIKFYKSPSLALAISMPADSFGTVPYLAGSILWLIDGEGSAKTECVNPVNGSIRASGPPAAIGSSGMMFSAAGKTYLMRTMRGDQVLEIDPTAACRA